MEITTMAGTLPSPPYHTHGGEGGGATVMGPCLPLQEVQRSGPDAHTSPLTKLICPCTHTPAPNTKKVYDVLCLRNHKLTPVAVPTRTGLYPASDPRDEESSPFTAPDIQWFCCDPKPGDHH
ncbi:unnamed protein product [Lota lota]